MQFLHFLDPVDQLFVYILYGIKFIDFGSKHSSAGGFFVKAILYKTSDLRFLLSVVSDIQLINCQGIYAVEITADSLPNC